MDRRGKEPHAVREACLEHFGCFRIQDGRRALHFIPIGKDIQHGLFFKVRERLRTHIIQDPVKVTEIQRTLGDSIPDSDLVQLFQRNVPELCQTVRDRSRRCGRAVAVTGYLYVIENTDGCAGNRIADSVCDIVAVPARTGINKPWEDMVPGGFKVTDEVHIDVTRNIVCFTDDFREI